MPRGVFKRTAEHNTANSAAHLGKKLSSEHCAAIGVAIMKKWQDHTYAAKLVKAHKGKPNPKLSAAITGKKRIRKYKKYPKMSAALRNNPKLSTAMKKYCAEHPGVHKGKSNGMWRGGPALGDYPLAFWQIAKNIRARDKVCQLCGKTKLQEGKSLSVHHINHDVEDLFELNLITLCNSCNGKVNGKREDFYTDYFAFRMTFGLMLGKVA